MRTIENDPVSSFEQNRFPAPNRRKKDGEGMKAFDYTSRHYLQMSGQEFLDRYDAGAFENSTETGVQRVLAMLPFVR